MFNFERGNKFFELRNHLGNVLVTISDKKIGVSSNGTTIDYYNADVITANDYYPFGMTMPGRKYSNSAGAYRYGFNGKENDNEVKGDGNQQDYGARIYDPRLGRFLSVDPLSGKFPNESPYSYAGDNPIGMIDPDGQAKYSVHLQYDAKTGKYTILKILKSSGLKPKVISKWSSMYVDHVDWYNYQTFTVTVINADPKIAYDIKIPDQIIGKIVTTTSHELTNNETWAKFKTNDEVIGGVMFTSEDGPGLNVRKGEAEFMANIEGVMAAIGGIATGGPKLLEIPKVDDVPEIADKIKNLAAQLYKDITLLPSSSEVKSAGYPKPGTKPGDVVNFGPTNSKMNKDSTWTITTEPAKDTSPVWNGYKGKENDSKPQKKQ